MDARYGTGPVRRQAASAGRVAPSVTAACRRFQIDGELVTVEAFERGHIHDTYVSTWERGDGPVRFLHQRINHSVFTDVAGLMRNIRLVTEHLERKLDGDPAGFHTLQLVPARSGDGWLVTGGGEHWRTYHFIEDTRSYDHCADSAQAFEAARVFGRFQSLLADIDVSELAETIPRFFSTPWRFEQLREAVRADRVARCRQAEAEIAFALEREPAAGIFEENLASGRLARRVVHGDTKLNNVLFCVTTGEPVSVVDLDTCMPAYSLYDFGDLVRFTAARHDEDETDLSRAGVDLEIYRALADGYLENAATFLTAHEVELMPAAARVVTLTIGVRFLADFLAGDVYFKTRRPEHNLDRCRAQFAMVRDMERQERALRVAR